MNHDSRIFVAGHRGLVGGGIARALRKKGHERLVLKTRQELDLLDQRAVHEFFRSEKISHVFLAAAKVGGIQANQTLQADFLYENLMIAANIIHAAAQSKVSKLLFLGSSCIYPKMAPQPLLESSLLTGPLESTNEGYAIAKIAGLKLCEMYKRQYGLNFISAMPTNLYGPGDNFHPELSHVIPGMMRRFHEAKIKGASEVVIWGTGTPMREFLHVDDLSNALLLLMDRYNEAGTINVGTGEDCTIADLAQTMKRVVGYEGRLVFDPTKPDGTPRKVLDVSRMRALGWAPQFGGANGLEYGLKETYVWALNQKVL